MELSTTSPPAASSSSFLFIEQNKPNSQGGIELVCQSDNKLTYIDPRTLGVREAARQRWEELKPIIQRIYIEEDRSYPYLANILRTQYGFETTYNYLLPLLSSYMLMYALENDSFRERLSNGNFEKMFRALSDRIYYSPFLRIACFLPFTRRTQG
jgi:hypothetical protein